MNRKSTFLFGCMTFLLLTTQLTAQDQTLKEFKAYVSEKLGDQLSDSQLNAVAQRVDKDSDNVISSEEFENRMTAIQAVLANSADSGEDDRSQAPSNRQPAVEVVEIPALTNSTDATVLLITADELAEAWLPFAKWKTQQGKLTKIMTVHQIDRDFDADSIQEKIRLCVRQHIDEHNTLWVVLGGDCLPNGKGLVPGGHQTVHRQEREGIPTDIVYLSPTNWDTDGDGIYGEFEDDREAITYPDGSIGLGRIPVRTTADVEAFTSKVIAYESNYPTTSFAANMIYTCTDSPAYPKVRNSWDSYLSKVWDGEMGRFFSQETPWDEKEKPGSYALNPANVVKLFNDKTTSKMHIHGHGHLPAWVLEKSQFTGKHLEQLDNQGAYPLITTVSCNTGEYDSNQDPSIVEHMLRLPNAGSVAVVAPVRTGKPHFANRSDFRLMVTEGKLDGTTLTMTRYWTFGLGEGNTTGHAIMKAKHAMAEDATKSAAYHLCICELNLLGDPTLDMRAKTPREPQLQIKSTDIKGSHRITVSTAAPGCQVCMWNGADEYRIATANDKGVAVAFMKSNPADILFSAYGENLNSVSQKGLSK